MGRLTTHVLDTSLGRPAAGVRVELERVDGERIKVADTLTNEDGRVDRPLLEGDTFVAGVYELRFHAGEYFRGRGLLMPDPAFLDLVVLRFGIASPGEHYHVPLLISPYAYSTYRGS